MDVPLEKIPRYQEIVHFGRVFLSPPTTLTRVENNNSLELCTPTILESQDTLSEYLHQTSSDMYTIELARASDSFSPS